MMDKCDIAEIEKLWRNGRFLGGNNNTSSEMSLLANDRNDLCGKILRLTRSGEKLVQCQKML